MFRELAFENLAQKWMPWCLQTCSGRGRTTSGYSWDPTQEKPFSSPVAAGSPAWAFSYVAKASVQTLHGARSPRELR